MNKTEHKNVGVKVKKVHVVVDSNGYCIKPGRLNITEEKISKYVKDNPMPEDSAYSLSDLIIDLTYHGYADCSLLMLPIGIKEETAHYIGGLIDGLRNDGK